MASDFQRCACCSHRPAAPSVHQTLEEMEFERGIWSAALDGDLDRVRSFLNKGVDPNVLDQAGYTALHYASRSGSESVCALLLSQKACPNPRTKGGATPLHRAAYCGRLGVLKLLLDAGADPLLCDDDGASPLHKAEERPCLRRYVSGISEGVGMPWLCFITQGLYLQRQHSVKELLPLRLLRRQKAFLSLTVSGEIRSMRAADMEANRHEAAAPPVRSYCKSLALLA
uniref:Ankyrin repeat domain 39 n=1 Tax=Scleropages formosus TaxID=113540 RepID=A0A8C9WD90_SCLFO